MASSNVDKVTAEGFLRIQNISKSFHDTEAIKHVSISIEEGDFVVLVGPSGCGKSTLLRIAAGLEAPSSGRLVMNGSDITDLAPSKRDIAMVFQDYALYPNMTVFENIAFPLRVRKVPRKEIAARVRCTAESLGIADLLARRPSKLSGGQQQRVAIGRALVREPALYLMDEPLSNLDAKLRIQMRAELARLHRSTGATIVYVTHDQTEALTLGTKVVVLNDGVVQQIGSPLDVYGHPANTFVAGFVGAPPMNLLKGKLHQGMLNIQGSDRAIAVPRYENDSNADVVVGVRPEDIDIEEAGSERNAGPFEAPLSCGVVRLRVSFQRFEFTGSDAYVFAEVQGTSIAAKVHSRGLANLAPDSELTLFFDSSSLQLFDAVTGLRLETQRS